ncbi:JAB domain-containing protein [Bacteroides eggerthii]|uniref:RadC-like JAB domain-containing protein n=1 Tax=Bacteroides eggerthii TaxID=28111 RepID=A0A7X9XJZ0_9BACE|nr:JAB domain-containing protein [Bacteroides eggerthii]NME87933.1 hypothetical protein [Bacteroides eggerthii]
MDFPRFSGRKQCFLSAFLHPCRVHPVLPIQRRDRADNQPSGNDKQVTERLKKAGEVFDIRLIDHVIIAGDTYYSFADEGCL